MRNSSRDNPRVKRGNQADLHTVSPDAVRHGKARPSPFSQTFIEHTAPPLAGAAAAADSDAAGPLPRGAGLPISDQLPDARAGRTAITILDALQHTASEHGYFAAGEEAARKLRAARELHSTERRFVSDALADIVRGLRRLRTLADRKKMGGRALYITHLIDRHVSTLPAGESALGTLPRVIGHKATDLGLQVEGIVTRVQTLATRMQNLGALPVAEQITTLGEALSYPDWLVAALLGDLGLDGALAVLRAQNRRAPLTARANLLKCTRAELRDRLRSEGVVATDSVLATHALRLQTRINAYALPAFTDGWFELQDEGSQLIAELCAPPPAALVLDACAGAGGKTLAIGALLGNKGRIVAVDTDRRRLTELQKRARRAGLSCVQTVYASSTGQPGERGGAPAGLPFGVLTRGAQRVLCDVPCSGLGVLRRHPEARWHLGPKALDQINVQQRQILAASAAHVQPHGRLVYATCTILRRENDDVVDEFLATHPEFVEVPVKELLGGERAQLLGDGKRLRLLPTEDGPDGFFAVVLRRRED